MKPTIHIRKHGKVTVLDIDTTPRAKVLKIDADRQIVFGWANVCVQCDGETVVDSHRDSIDPEELENAAYNFTLNFGGMGEDHEGETKGKLIESMFFTKEKLELMGLPSSAVHQGWWVGFLVEDKAAWSRVKRGEHKMFSIQGVGQREEVA